MIKKIIIFIIVILSFSELYAQQNKIEGVLINIENLTPIPNVRVSVKNSSQILTTNAKGEFTLFLESALDKIEFNEILGFSIVSVTETKPYYYTIKLKLKPEDIFQLSMEDLMKITAVSASNKVEKISDVPATMIIISKEDIRQRGYSSLLEVLQDLPGMDLSVSFGVDNYFKNYWRGYRTTWNAPYLLMVDGMIQNDLSYNRTNIGMTFPLSNLEKIEVVYGPVSSVYGANAFMGVINIISKNDQLNNGVSANFNTQFSFNNRFTGDYNLFAKKGKTRFSLAAKYDYTDLNDLVDTENTVWANTELNTNKKLWGEISDWLAPEREHKHPLKFTGIDLRVFHKNLEIGFLTNQLFGGYGLTYPTDKAQAGIPSLIEYQSLHARYTHKLTEKLNSRTRLRYYANDWDQAEWITGYNITNTGTNNQALGSSTLSPGESTRVIDYSVWTVGYHAYTFEQDFDWNINKNLEILSGFKYEYQFITKQIASYGSAFRVKNVDHSSPGFIPSSIPSYQKINNGFVWENYGLYAQAKYQINEKHILNLGLRFDDNSNYDSKTTLRAGYVGSLNTFSWKLLYGQSYRNPPPRTLYSVWEIAGSSTDLDPETSQTFEANLAFKKKDFNSWLSFYYIINDKTISSEYGTARNLGDRNVTGIDFHAEKKWKGKQWQTTLWGYYSTILNEEEHILNPNTNTYSNDIIGDLAEHKFYLGLNTNYKSIWNLNLRGRYIGNRKTVHTNPLKEVDAYACLDMNITYSPKKLKGIQLGLKINNLTDTKYEHPGIFSANAGNTTGSWNGNVYNGSQGWFNSLLPQPGRSVMISLRYEIE